MDSAQFNIVESGGRTTLWIDSGRIAECMAYYYSNNIDVVGINPMQGYVLADVKFLEEYVDIRGLAVVPPPRGIDLTGISALKSLEYLSVGENEQPLDLSAFPKLEEFRGDWHRLLRFPDCMPTLRALHLWKFKPKSKDLGFLPELPALEELGLTQSSIVSLDGLARFSCVRRLHLAYNRALAHLDAIPTLRNLEQLECDRCPKLRNYEVLAKAARLRVLCLHGCGPLASLGFLRSMPQLEAFRFVDTDVEDGDLSPLINLKQVGFINKKHFSHTFEEVQIAIAERTKAGIN